MNNRILRKILLLVTVLMVVFAMASCKKKEEGIKTTISIDVSKIFDHEADLNKDKADFVPEDGMILKKVTVVIGKDSNALDQLREALSDDLPQSIRIVGVCAHDIAGGVSVKIPDRQCLHLVKHIRAGIVPFVQDTLRFGKTVVVHQLPRIGGVRRVIIDVAGIEMP